jgi:FkbM family methyltransferase
MNPKLIYDVGMHNGDDTAYYLRRGFRVVAIEPNPTLVATASERFCREIEAGELKILNVGVAAEDGELPFWVCETDSRLMQRPKTCPTARGFQRQSSAIRKSWGMAYSAWLSIIT